MAVTAELPFAMGGLEVAVFGDSVDATYTALAVPIDVANYDSISSARWEITYESNAVAENWTVDLVDESATVYATFTLAPTATVVTRAEVAFTPSGSHTYTFKIHGNAIEPYSLLLIKSLIWLKVNGTTKATVQVLLADMQASPGSAGLNDDGTQDNLDSYQAQIFNTTYGSGGKKIPIWKWTAANWSQVTTITFRATVAQTAGTGNISLFDNGTSTQMVASELTFTSATPTVATASLTTANFTDGHSYWVQFKCSAGAPDFTNIYSAALYINLDCSENCEVYIPLGSDEIVCIGSGFYDLGTRLKLNTSYYSGTNFYYEMTALQVGTTTQSGLLVDAGTSETAYLTATSVSGSTISGFSTGTYMRIRTGSALSFTDGNRLMEFNTEGPGLFEGLRIGAPSFILGVLAGTSCGSVSILVGCASASVGYIAPASTLSAYQATICTPPQSGYLSATSTLTAYQVTICTAISAGYIATASVSAVCNNSNIVCE